MIAFFKALFWTVIFMCIETKAHWYGNKRDSIIHGLTDLEKLRREWLVSENKQWDGYTKRT